ncbi:MAG: glycosyltransferase [Crocosphaera sp.]|nr:glycosyltransferase [Crocosphaera sp.]
MITISAVICTFNRAKYLRKAINSLVNQTLESDKYEILVVDNCSTDETKTIVTEDFSHISNLSYLYEPIQGLSQARNTGWKQAKGDYIAYLDDDAIAVPQWLEIILRTFETVEPQPGAVGGKIEPIWETSRPPWLSDRLTLGLTVLDWSKEPHFLQKKQWLAGANIAYPKHILDKFHGFNTSLGRKKTNLLSCEEALLNNKLKSEGYQLYYHPDAMVSHHIPASRLTKDWHIKRQFWNGISGSVALRYQTTLILSVRMKRVWSLMKNDIFKLFRQIIFPPNNKIDEIFDNQCKFLYKIGTIYGLLFYRIKSE